MTTADLPSVPGPSTSRTGGGLDPRGLRFAATVTTLVLAIALVTGNEIVLAFQVVVFAIGALAGPAASPYSWAFRRWIRPRLGAPADTEDAAPARFAQAVGLGFAAIGLVAELAGLTAVAFVAVGVALVAAFLNAAFSFCLGCRFYLLIRRLRSALRPAASSAS